MVDVDVSLEQAEAKVFALPVSNSGVDDVRGDKLGGFGERVVSLGMGSGGRAQEAPVISKPAAVSSACGKLEFGRSNCEVTSRKKVN
jgi:hypothetical protein